MKEILFGDFYIKLLFKLNHEKRINLMKASTILYMDISSGIACYSQNSSRYNLSFASNFSELCNNRVMIVITVNE